MSDQRVGTCSICGGDVYGYRGVWLSISPPPPDKCGQCGAVARADVIDMTPMPSKYSRTGTATGEPNPNRESQQEYFGIKK